MLVPAPTPATPQSRGYFARLKDAVQAGTDWLFGFDFFLSYSHRDGKNYPRKLLDALERSGYRVFLDQRDYMAGTELRSATDRRIRRSSVVVVISRPAALQSAWVGHEVNRTLALGRTPVVIDINGSLSAADSETARLLMDRLHINERIDDLDGDPSLWAVDELRRSFRGTRQESRRFRALAIGALAFCILSIFAGWVAVVAVRQRNEAQRQNRISRARELAATSVSQLGVDPQRSLALAVQSMELTATDEGRTALRRALPNSRLRLTLRGDTGRITHVTFARDSRRLATVANNGTVYIWDLESGRVLDLRGHRRVVYGSRFSPDGTRFATAGWDSVAGLWDAATGGGVARLSAGGAVDYVQFSADGSRLLTAGRARPGVWDARTGRFLFPLEGYESRSGPGAFSADGRWIVTGGWEPRARIWDGHTGRLVRTLHMPSGLTVDDAAFSPDGRWVVATGDGITRVWKTDGWTEFRDIEGEHQKSSFNAAGTLLLMSGPGGAEVWETTDWTRVAVLRGATSAVFSPDGQRIATTSGERIVRVWDLVPGAAPDAAGRVLMELRQPDEQVLHAEFSPDGQKLVTAGVHTAHVWDVGEVAPLVTLTDRRDVGPLTISPDGRWLVTSTEQGVVVWDARSWRAVRRLGGRNAAAFSHRGRYLLVGGDQLYVWDTGTWQPVVELARGRLRGDIIDVAVTRDGRLAATAGGADSVALWNMDRWTRAGSLPPTVYSFNIARFSPDGRWLFVGGPQTATVWRQNASGTWTRVHDLTQATGGTRFADFSPDGRQLVTAGWESTQIWDAVRWMPLRDLQGFTVTVDEARYSPDGRWIVTAGGDGSVRLWHAESGEAAWIVERGENVRLSADFAADGQSIVTTSESGTLRVYPCLLCGADGRLLEFARSHRARVIQVRPDSIAR